MENKKIKSHEDSDFLLKEVSEAIQNEVKQQKGGFLSMLLGTLDVILSKNMSTVFCMVRIHKSISLKPNKGISILFGKYFKIYFNMLQ